MTDTQRDLESDFPLWRLQLPHLKSESVGFSDSLGGSSPQLGFGNPHPGRVTDGCIGSGGTLVFVQTRQGCPGATTVAEQTPLGSGETQGVLGFHSVEHSDQQWLPSTFRIKSYLFRWAEGQAPHRA